MKLYYGGGEIPTHRKWLAANGITHVYLSYMGLSRRVKFARPWLIDEKFPADMRVLLDAGAYTVNKEGADHEPDELARIATGYEAFVALNHERVDAFTEFDALPLGLDWIKSRREDYYDDLGDKFLPVWHAEWGLDELERMAGKYRRISVLQTALGDRDLVPVLNMLAASRGTLLHGLAMTKPDIMREVRWDSVGSTSWISPMQYGDTFVWTGRELKRYPRAYKEQSRKRHRTLFATHGFDPDKIMADDTAEVARLSLWSWEQFLTDLNSHAPGGGQPVDKDSGLCDSGVAVGDGEPVPAVTIPPRQRETILLPSIQVGEDTGLQVRSDSLRRCNTCFLATRGCPGYEADATCLYNIPITARTKEDIDKVEEGILAMQTQRVMFMRMVEDLEGGFPDPNLSNEIDRLTRMIKSKRDGSMIRERLTLERNTPGELGMIGRIFNPEVAAAQHVEQPKLVDEIMGEVLEVTDVPLKQKPQQG